MGELSMLERLMNDVEKSVVEAEESILESRRMIDEVSRNFTWEFG